MGIIDSVSIKSLDFSWSNFVCLQRNLPNISVIDTVHILYADASVAVTATEASLHEIILYFRAVIPVVLLLMYLGYKTCGYRHCGGPQETV